MASPFLPVLLGLLLGGALGAAFALLAGRASRAAERQAAAAVAQQAEARAMEHNARVEELAALRAEHAAVAQHRETLRAMVEDLRVTQARIEAEHASLRDRQAPLEAGHAQALEEHKVLRQDLAAAREALQGATTQLSAEREAGEQLLRVERAAAAERVQTEKIAAEEKLALLAEARVALSHQFETLAARIFDEKAKRFGEQNQSGMETLLAPMREKLGEFQSRVEALKEDGIAGRTELRTHLESLRTMNDRLSAGADNLVKALKGSSKTQGDWGEVLLAGILEAAGLRAGKEYRLQQSFANEEGRHVRPDVILDLPQGKHLVIDSKVSLNSYTDYCACDDEESRKSFLNRHARSVRDHIDGLSKKVYQGLHQLQSLDFVIMFVPIEPAYMLALAHDGSLWERAWNKDVLLVSPGTLYPILRTIQYAWQQERQSKNVEEIVRQGGALYDKVALFATSFEEVGKRLGSARNAYDKAWGQLATGRGHVLNQFEKLRELGIRNSRPMPSSLIGDEESACAEDRAVASALTASDLLPLSESGIQ